MARASSGVVRTSSLTWPWWVGCAHNHLYRYIDGLIARIGVYHENVPAVAALAADSAEEPLTA